MLIAALGLTAVGGIVAAIFGGRADGRAAVGHRRASAPRSARLAFDSIVQRDAPDANRGRAFARFETRFQLGWVLGRRRCPCVIPIPRLAGLRHRRPPSPPSPWCRTWPGPRLPAPAAASCPSSCRRRAWRGDANGVGAAAPDRRRATPLPPPAPPPPADRVLMHRNGRHDRSARRGGTGHRSMRASQRPGASTSAGVGSSPGRLPQAAQAVLAGPLDHAGDEGVAPLDRGLREGEAEQPLDEAVGLVGLDPPAPDRLGDPGAGPTRPRADGVHDVVDVADDRRRRGRRAGAAARAAPATAMAPSSTSGSPSTLLEVGHAAGVGRVEGAELVAQGVGVGLEAGHVRHEQRSSSVRTWGTPSTAWLAISCRQTHSRRSSTGRLHVLAEGVDGGDHHVHLVATAGRGIGQVVLAERAAAPGGRPSSPTDMPSIIGDSICIRPPNMAMAAARRSSSVGAGGAGRRGRGPSVPARCSNSGR